MRPSFLYHQTQAVLIILIIIIIIYLLYNGSIKLLSYELVMIGLLLTITIGIHSNLHYQEEIHFNFNPIIGNTKVHNYPYYSDDHGMNRVLNKN